MIFKPNKVSTRKESFRKVNLVFELTVFCEETEFCGKMWVREGGHKKKKKRRCCVIKVDQKRTMIFIQARRKCIQEKRKRKRKQQQQLE